MPIATASLDAVPDAIRTWRPDAIVSALSPGRDASIDWQGPRLLLGFTDREAPHPPPGPTRYPVQRPCILPQIAHLQGFLAFVEAHAGERILIHCRAGLGRSPALAIVALVAGGLDPRRACSIIHAAVPEASPNRLVLRHAEACMGEAIAPIAEGMFSYSRGRAGAVGHASGLRIAR